MFQFDLNIPSETLPHSGENLSEKNFEEFITEALEPNGQQSWLFSNQRKFKHVFSPFICSGMISSTQQQTTKGYWQSFQLSINIPVFGFHLPDISYFGAILGSVLAGAFFHLTDTATQIWNQQIFIELANLWVNMLGRPLGEPTYYENDFLSMQFLNVSGKPLKGATLSRVDNTLLRDYFLYTLQNEPTNFMLESTWGLNQRDLARLRLACFFSHVFSKKELSVQEFSKTTGTEISVSDSAWISSEVRPDADTDTARITLHFSKFFAAPVVIAASNSSQMPTGCETKRCGTKIGRIFSKSKKAKSKLILSPKGLNLNSGEGKNCILECIYYYFERLGLTDKLQIYRNRSVIKEFEKKMIDINDRPTLFCIFSTLPFSIMAAIENEEGSFEARQLYKPIQSSHHSLQLLIYKLSDVNSWHAVMVDSHDDYLSKVVCKTCGEYFSRGSSHLNKCTRCADCLKFILIGGKHYLSCKGKPFLTLENNEKSKVKKPEQRNVELKQNKAEKWQLTTNVWFCDFECFPTKEGIHVPYLIVLKEIGKTNQFHTFMGKPCLKDFTDFILKGGKVSGYLFCHNGSGYDFNLILLGILRYGNIPPKGLQILSRGTKILTAKIKTKPFSLELRDSYLYLPSSLSRLCRDFKIEQSKAKLSFDHSKIGSFADFSKHMGECITYCKQDVVALEEIYKKFAEGLWEVAPVALPKSMSLAAHALEMWKHLEDSKIISNISIPNFDHYEILRSMYHGGRVLCTTQKYDSFMLNQMLELDENGNPLFWDEETSLSEAPFGVLKRFFMHRRPSQKEELKIVDVVSLYPYCMAEFLYPVGEFLGVTEIKTPEARVAKAKEMERIVSLGKRPLTGNNIGFSHAYGYLKKEMFRSCYKVDMECPENIIVAFLMRKVNDTPEQSLKPLRNHWVTGIELFEAIRIGYKLNVIHAVMAWEMSKPIFKKYITILFDLKEKHKADKTSVMYIVAKLLMNALSGKFGQKVVTKVVTLMKDLPDDPDSQFDGLKNIAMQVVEHQNVETFQIEKIGYIFTGDKFGEKLKATLPTQLSVFILAYSRRVMSKMLRKVNGYRNEAHTLLYTDTDSMVIRKSTFDLLTHHGFIGSKLGQLTDEYPKDIIVAGRFLAPKCYCLCMLREVEGKAATCYKIRCKGIPHRGDDFLARDYKLTDDSFEVQLKNIEESLSGPVGDLGKRFYVVKEKATQKEVAVNPFINLEICNMLLSGDYFLHVHFGSIMKSRDKTQKFHLKTTWIHRSLGLTSWWNKPDCPRIFNPDPYAITYPVKGADVTPTSPKPDVQIIYQNQEEYEDIQRLIGDWINDNPVEEQPDIIAGDLVIPDPSGGKGFYTLSTTGQLSYEDTEGFGVDI